MCGSGAGNIVSAWLITGAADNRIDFMLNSLVMLVFLLAGAGGGGVLLYISFRKKRVSLIDKLAVCIVCGPLFLSLAALCLADAGRFTIRNLFSCVAVWLLLGVACCLADRKRLVSTETCSDDPGGSRSLILLLLLAIILFARPFQYLRGGWDPGEYISTAMNISRTGSIEVKDSLIPVLDVDRREVLLHEKEGLRRTLQAGYLIVDEESGKVVPDYFHLYPSWLAIFAGLFGLTGVYYGQYIISIYALAIFFLAIRRIFGRTSAEIGALMLVLSPAQIYFARFPGAEMLTQFLLFSAFYFLARRPEDGDWRSELMGAVGLAAAFLSHSTALLAIVGVALFLFTYGLMFGLHSIRRVSGFIVITVLAAFWRSAVMADTMIGFLFSFLWNHPKLIVPGMVAALLTVSMAIWSLRLFEKNRMNVLDMEWLTRWVPGLMVTFAGLFLYFMRPRFFPGQEARNMVLIGQLISPLGLIMSAAFFFRQRWSKWTAGQWLFMMAGTVTCAVLIAHKMIHPLYMWAIRRYVPFVVPFFCVLASVPLALLCDSRAACRKTAGSLILGLILTYCVYQSYPAIKVREYDGLPDFMRRVAGHLADADFILCDHWKYSTPLRYAFGLPAYQLSRQQEGSDIDEARRAVEILKDMLEDGASVYYLSVGGPFFSPFFHLEYKAYEFSRSPHLTAGRYQLPREINYDVEKAHIYELRKTDMAFVRPVDESVCVDIGYHSLGLREGFHSMQKSAKETFRWTAGKASLYMPSYGPAVGTRYIFRLAAKRPPEMGQETVPVDICVNGSKLSTLLVENDWKEYEVILSADSSDGSVVTVDLVVPTWDPANYGIHGYPSDLGVRVDWIKAETAR